MSIGSCPRPYLQVYHASRSDRLCEAGRRWRRPRTPALHGHPQRRKGNVHRRAVQVHLQPKKPPFFVLTCCSQPAPLPRRNPPDHALPHPVPTSGSPAARCSDRSRSPQTFMRTSWMLFIGSPLAPSRSGASRCPPYNTPRPSVRYILSATTSGAARSACPSSHSVRSMRRSSRW